MSSNLGSCAFSKRIRELLGDLANDPGARVGTVAAVYRRTVLRVEAVDFITIPTRDKARAFAWYRDVLALPESDATEGELETPNVTLVFWEPEAEDVPFVPNEAGFALRVPDVADARAELEAKGVQFIDDTWDSGVCHIAVCRDPDGNAVVLHRRYVERGKQPERGDEDPRR
jgi:catechol 2,3-dioxygenase-like lactoylglutathione lyase family enzyme